MEEEDNEDDHDDVAMNEKEIINVIAPSGKLSIFLVIRNRQNLLAWRLFAIYVTIVPWWTR